MKYFFQLILSYDGSIFFGWQKNNAGTSIEELLEKALLYLFKKDILLEAASRTDRGVHALGQVIKLSSQQFFDPKTIQSVTNRMLPSSIRILNVSLSNKEFKPSISAIKTYRYNIYNGLIQYPHDRNTSWHITQPLDENLMRLAGNELIGTHDFKSFCNHHNNIRYTSTIRTIYKIQIINAHPFFYIKITGSAFMYKMARNIVGLIIYAGVKKINIYDIQTIIQARDRSKNAITAPAQGLFLESIIYENRSNL